MKIKAFTITFLFAILLLSATLSVSAQNKDRAHLDSLLRKLPAAKADTNKVNLLIKLGHAYFRLKKPDSAAFYVQPALTLIQKLQWEEGFYHLFDYYWELGAYDKVRSYAEQTAEFGLKNGKYKLVYVGARSILYAARAQKIIPEGIGRVKSLAGQMEKRQVRKELADMYALIADFSQEIYNYSEAVSYDDKALALEEADHRQYLSVDHILGIAYLNTRLHNTNKARAVLQKGETAYKAARDPNMLDAFYHAFAYSYNEDHNYKTAIAYDEKCVRIEEQYFQQADPYTEIEMGWDYFLMKNYDQAYAHTVKAMSAAKKDSAVLAYVRATLGSIYREAPESVIKKAGLKPREQYEQSVKLLTEAINYQKKHYDGSKGADNDNLNELSKTYEKMHRYADAFKTYKAYITTKDSLDSLQDAKAALLKEAQLNYSHKEDALTYKQAITNSQLKQKKLQSYFFIGGISLLLVLTIFIWLNYNNQRKSNKLLSDANHQLGEQRGEITSQRDQLATTINDLKAAQHQLIQSEKMASLGELTAGIAHEIQNPLNFVNNFSDVNREMLDELDEELNKGDVAEAKAIAADIRKNEEKINHHGKRADGIVKGMLEHSRASTGQKEPTDLNKLADEYLRLAYHGLRAKDKNFNASLVTHFDEGLPAANIIAQDIGRVLLNLFNNAFYAVQQKVKDAGPGYKPNVDVSTAAENGLVTIKVSDNGNGIPAAIKDKVMQPFFTTKPTGEGTGLGLSLSYDIVVKGHGGKIELNTKEGSGSEFMIILPM